MNLCDLLSYDNTVSTVNIESTKTLFQEGRPYYTIETTTGLNYKFSDTFVSRSLVTISTGVFGSYSSKEKLFLDKYLSYKLDNVGNDDDVLAFDKLLGGL